MTSVRPQWCGATIGLRERISGTARTYAGVAAGQDWSKGSAELSIRARALSLSLSLEYRSECTGVRLFCLVIIYHAPRAQACNLRETPFECFAECLSFASFNLADYRHRYIGAGLRRRRRQKGRRSSAESSSTAGARDIYFVLAWISSFLQRAAIREDPIRI